MDFKSTESSPELPRNLEQNFDVDRYEVKPQFEISKYPKSLFSETLGSPKNIKQINLDPLDSLQNIKQINVKSYSTYSEEILEKRPKGVSALGSLALTGILNPTPSTLGKTYDSYSDKQSRELMVDLEEYQTTENFGYSRGAMSGFRVSEYRTLKTEYNNAQAAARQRAAHHFRGQRMRLGGLADITRHLQDLPGIKSGVAAVVQRAKQLLQGTQTGSEKHRAYAPLIAGLMNEPVMQQEFLHSIDTNAADETIRLWDEARSEDGLATDVLVIGAGPQGAIFSARLRDEAPEKRIVAIDAGSQLGGQFRSYGERPVFFINSRNFRPQDNQARALPGYEGNLNSFGSQAPVQVTDFSSETYPTNQELGVSAALNQYLSAETMLGTRLTYVEKTNSGYRVTVTATQTGEQAIIHTQKVVVATGLGERLTLANEDTPGVWTAEDVFKHFGNADNMFPMDAFTGKRIAIVGGGDSGRVVAELLTRLGPKDAYGKSSVQFGGPEAIRWFGTDFADREEFCAVTRPRYQRLASFISRRSGFGPSQTLEIQPSKAKITGSEQLFGSQVYVTRDDGGTESFDLVIDATSLGNDALDPFRDIQGTLQPISEYVRELGDDAAIAQAINPDILFVGPVARLPLTRGEQRTFGEGIKENTASIWANQIRTNRAAVRIARALQ